MFPFERKGNAGIYLRGSFWTLGKLTGNDRVATVHGRVFIIHEPRVRDKKGMIILFGKQRTIQALFLLLRSSQAIPPWSWEPGQGVQTG